MNKIFTYSIVSIFTTLGLSVLGAHMDSKYYGSRFPYDSSAFFNIVGTPLGKANVKVREEVSRDPRERLPPKALKILKRYYREHVDPDYPDIKPDPTTQEKEQLLSEMNYIITMRQLNHWFVNARRRKHENYLK